jgi:imidazolonepropionase
MNANIFIKNAGELITLKGKKRPRTRKEMRELGVVIDGAVIIHNGKIISTGETKELEKQVKRVGKVKTIDAGNKVVMPGFVDPHTHLIFAGSRENELELKLKGATYIDILKKGGGILNTVKATRKASKKELISSAISRLDTMLEFGTTTVEAKSGYGLAVKDEIKMLEAIREIKHPVDIVPTFMGAHAIPLEYIGKEDAYVDLIIDKMLPEIAKRDLAEFCDVFCEKGVFTIEQSRKLLEAAKKYKLIPKIHADEIVDTGGAALAAEIGAISAEHLLMSSQKGLDAMAKKKIIATLLPASVFTMMLDTHANARYMIESGIPIALGTDLCPNCWTESMQTIISMACYKMKMLPSEAITAATINAAYSINRGSDVGSIEVGKNADIIILNTQNYKFIPYRFGVNLVDKVIKNGVFVVDNGKKISQNCS